MIGGIADTGDEFGRPVLARGVRLAVVRSSQLPPPLTNGIQSPPVYLQFENKY